MINNRYVTPVSLSTAPHQTEVHIPDASEITDLLANLGVEVTLGERLKGGFVSEVYAAQGDDQPVVVKYTRDTIDTDPSVYFLPHEAHYVDTQLLKYLGKSGLRVPRVLEDFSDIPITVMEDLRAAGFELLHDLIMSGKLPTNAAVSFGRDLAAMMQSLGKHDEFETALSGRQNYYERGFELRQAYPNDQAWFKKLEERFTTANQQLIAVDTHPKNSFVDKDGNMAWIDFGFSAWADRDFALPNGLAHIAIYALTGHISVHEAAAFIETAVEAYRQQLPIDDEVICTYLAAEVLHRWAGKWISGVDTSEQKLRLLGFGMKVFDEEVFSLQSLATLLKESV